MGHLITIGYQTSRKNPMIELFLRTLKRELNGAHGGVQLIVVDFYLNNDEDGSRKGWLMDLVAKEGLGGIDLCHVLPKPTVWQGKHKLTKNHHFAASNSRNTIFALTKHDFVACVDDLSVLLPGWLDNALHARHHGYVALGAYKKVLKLNAAENGDVTYEEFQPGIDSRWPRGSGNGIIEVDGAWMFGCSFALPIEFALKVNGFDEICDGTGLEDVEFGCRLHRANCKIFYNRNMLTYESEEGHTQEGNQKFVRESKMTKMGIMSDWYIHNFLIHGSKTWTEGNTFNLRDLRNHVLNGNPFPIPTSPTHDWRDGAPLSEV